LRNGSSAPKKISVKRKLRCAKENILRTIPYAFIRKSAEKYVKAFLVRHRIHFRKIHDLLRLKILCMEADPTFDLISESLALLFPYAVDARYPGFRATEQDARAAVAAMKQVRTFVRARLGLKSK
jgi:HEPN domain-containing protein